MKALLCSLALLFCKSLSAAGVTIITHGGLNPLGVPNWVYEMQDAIKVRLMCRSSSYTFTYFSKTLKTDDANDSCDLILVVDWSAESFKIGGADLVGIALANALVNPPTDGSLKTPLAEMPLHFIGHSRGAYINSACIHHLASFGIIVDHNTILDAQDAGPDGTFGNWSNTLFSDAYYQTAAILGGFFVPGASNLDLTASLLLPESQRQEMHQLVHTWYHGTIDLEAKNVDREDILRWAWYKNSSGQQYPGGFFYTSIVSNYRPSAGLLTDGAFRDPTPRSKDPQWPNIGQITLSRSLLSVGDPLTVDFFYQDDDSMPTVVYYLDDDQNPYNGSTQELFDQVNRPLPKTYEEPRQWDFTGLLTNVAARDYYVYGKITDGEHTRYDYAPKKLTVVTPKQVNQIARLSTPRVSPTAGAINTSFNFRVDFVDPDGKPPVRADVFIDRIRNSMFLDSGQPQNGTYTYSATLGPGAHSFYYSFIDADLDTITTALISGPVVGLEGQVPVQFYFGGGGGVPVNDDFYLKCTVIGGETFTIPGNKLPYPGFTKLIRVPAQMQLEGLAQSPNHSLREWAFVCDGAKTETTAPVPTIQICQDETVISYWLYTPISYTLGGTVTDSNNNHIQGATVSISSGQSIATGSDGNYSFSNIPGGVPYTIKAEHPDYSCFPPSHVINNLIESRNDYDFKGISSDEAPPELSFTEIPPHYISETNSVTFSWAATDNKSSPQAIQYRYQLLGSTNPAWSGWTNETSISYTLINGIYTFNIHARDERLNETVLPLTHTFAISGSPRIKSATLVPGTLWITEIEIAVEVGAAGSLDKVILLPELLGLPRENLVPVRLYSNPKAPAIGTITYASEELGLPCVFEQAEIGFVFRLPSPLVAGQSRLYQIQWGELLHMGWEERVSTPIPSNVGDPAQNERYTLDSYLDSEGRRWWLGSTVFFMVSGEPLTRNSRLLLQVTDSQKRQLYNDSIDYFAANFTTDPSDPSNIIGTSRKFYGIAGSGGSFVEPKGEVWMFWRVDEDKEEQNQSFQSLRGFGFQRLRKDTLERIGNPIYSQLVSAQHFSTPILGPDGTVWVVGNSGDNREAFYLRITADGIILYPTQTLTTIPSDLPVPNMNVRASSIDTIPKVWFFFAKYWNVSDTNPVIRAQLSFNALNKDGTVAIPEQLIAASTAGPEVRQSDGRGFRGYPLLDLEAKSWVSYDTEGASGSGTFYSIFNADGTPYANTINVRPAKPRGFHFVDRDNKIWATDDNQLQILNADDTPAEPARTQTTAAPNRSIGSRAAFVDSDAFQIFDRWSTRSIELDLSKGTPVGTIEIIDVDKFQKGVHVENLVVSTGGRRIISLQGTVPQRSEHSISGLLSNDRAVLSFTQTGLLGGELLITFTTATDLPFVRGDANDDGHHDISDPLFILLHLFVHNVTPTCEDSLDANDSGAVDVSDAIYLLNWRFMHGRQPPDPFPLCEKDKTEDDLDCTQFHSCPK